MRRGDQLHNTGVAGVSVFNVVAAIELYHRMLTATDVAKHNNRDSCWIIVEGQVYDVTDFLEEHPGGANIILRYAGKVFE